jgi:hypothetical protein
VHTLGQALALGINLGVSRLGGVANNFLSPIFWDQNHVSLWMGAIICGASFMCGVALASIDKMAEKTLKAKNVNYVESEIDVRFHPLICAFSLLDKLI